VVLFALSTASLRFIVLKKPGVQAPPPADTELALSKP
jgi:hypothetical protein